MERHAPPINAEIVKYLSVTSVTLSELYSTPTRAIHIWFKRFMTDDSEYTLIIPVYRTLSLEDIRIDVS